MYKFEIGVMVDSFRLEFEQSIKKSAEVGASGIQIYATYGRMAPENLNAKQRKEVLDIIKSNGLTVSALCGDLGGHGFTVEKDNAWKIEKSKRILDLAKDLECNIVTTHIGVVPHKDCEKRRILQEACELVGEYGDSLDAYFAVETGPETAIVLKGFLDSLSSRGVRVNYDPANLVMVTGDDSTEGVYTLKDYIVHTHAKDGIMLKKTNPENIYNIFAEDGIEDHNLGQYFLETPLGEGKVNFDRYLKALDSIGYEGFLTIEREVGPNPEKDISAAVEFLKSKIYSK